MAQRLRTFTDAFRHFQESFWYEAANGEALRIDWRAVTGARSSTLLPDLLRHVRVPVRLRIAMADPVPELKEYNPDWLADAKHHITRWLRFFKRNAGAAKITGEVLSYRYTGTPSIHGFSLNDRDFYISYTEQQGSEAVVVQDDGYEFLRWTEGSDQRIVAFRSAFQERPQKRFWPPYGDLGDWVRMHVSRASEGDDKDCRDLVNLVLGAWGMRVLRDGANSEEVFGEQKRIREALLKDPSLVLPWLLGERPATATQPEMVEVSQPAEFVQTAAASLRMPTPNAQRRRGGRPRKEEKELESKVIAALSKHHDYDRGAVTKPATNRGLAEAYDLANNSLSRFLKAQFGNEGHRQYVMACRQRTIGQLLMVWNRESVRLYRTLRETDGTSVTPVYAE